MTSGAPGLAMPAFLAGDVDHPSAEELLVVEGEAGDAADQRPLDDVGRVEPAAEADFEDAGVGRRAREGEEARPPW